MSNSSHKIEDNKSEKQEGRWMGAIDAYSLAAERMFKNNPEPLVAFGVVYILASIASAVFQGKTQADVSYLPYETLVNFLLIVSVITYSLALADKRTISLREFFRPRAKTFFILLVTVWLVTLANVAALLLFILPFIWVVAWFYMAQFIVVDRNLGPIASLKESKRLGKNNKGKIWAMIGICGALSIGMGILDGIILAVVPEPIGIVLGAALGAILTVWYAVAFAILYRYLQTDVEHETQE